MLLVLDVGNSNITAGVFDNTTLIKTFRIDTVYTLTAKAYSVLLQNNLDDIEITDCVIGSVVNELTQVLKKACNKAWGIQAYIPSVSNCKGIEIALPQPINTGIDRIANAAAIKTLYDLPAIAVDIGTAVTLDIVSAKGEFIGGAILPGVNTQLKSLNLNTSKLPLINAKISEHAIGTTTEENILSGVIRGLAGAIDSLIEQCETELGTKATIIGTGGFSTMIQKYMKRDFDIINPNLTLIGLQTLYSKR